MVRDDWCTARVFPSRSHAGGRHDARRPPPPPPPLPDTDPLWALAAQYPAWSIHRSPFGYSAEHTSANGRHIRYLAGRSIEESADRLQTAEVVEP
jgi:hypothetical protein